MKQRILSAFMALVMLLTLLPISAFAEETPEPAEETVETVMKVPEILEVFPDNEDLFAMYVWGMLYGGDGANTLDSEYGKTKFEAGSANRQIYEKLVEFIGQIAEGSQASTEITVDTTGMGITYNESTESFVGVDTDAIVDVLMADCTYKLYWFDKTSGWRNSISYSNTGAVSKLIFKFAVAKSYSVSDTKGTYQTNTTKTGAAARAVENAQNVVNLHQNDSIYDKLLAYKNYICEQVSYDHAAPKETDTNGNVTQEGKAYGDPWQLISVFDGDDTTNVVCEGYAKAFKYLCDLSGIECYTVSGLMDGGTGAGGHMWNIVRIGGYSYLVDVTNCDAGDATHGNSIGYPNELFMRGAGTGSVTTGYTYALTGGTISYQYYDATSESGHTNQFELYGTNILTLAPKDYKDVLAQPSEPTRVEILNSNNQPVTSAAINRGESANFTAKVYDQNENGMSDQTVTWTSSDATIAAVDAAGKVTVLDTATSAGATTVTITASVGGATGVSATLTITVPAKHVHEYDTTEWKSDANGHWHQCKQCDSRRDEAAHTPNEGIEDPHATCTTAGVKTTTCTMCGYVMATENLPATGHKWNEGVETRPATCTQKGVKTFTCTVCNETRTEEIPTVPHTWDAALGKDNTHHWRVCTVCETEDTKTAHVWNDGKQTKAPTCTEKGTKEFTCTTENCGQTRTEEIAALGHKWAEEWAKDPDKHWRVCEREGCNATDEAVNHTFDSGKITTQPTYDAAGVKTFTCVVCQYNKKTEPVAQLEHHYSTAWSKDETNHWHACTDAGYTNEKKDNAAHTWDEGVQTTAPTYAAPGVKTLTCKICGQTKTEPVAKLEHNYSEAWSKDATNHWHACTDPGYTNLKKDEAAHTWDAGTLSEDGTKTVYECTCGATREEAAIGAECTYDADTWEHDGNKHWHVCTVHTTTVEKIAEADHIWTVDSTTNASHTTAGKVVYKCTCGATQEVEIPAHTVSTEWNSDDTKHWHPCTEASCAEHTGEANHNWDAGATTTQPSLTAPGVKTFICQTCGAKKLEILPQTDHTYSTAWSTDDDYHWRVCTDEGYETLITDKGLHDWGTGTITTPPSATTTGVRTYTCSVCQKTKTETVPATPHEHTWASDWSSDGSSHWHDCTANDCTLTGNGDKSGYGAHTFTNDVCSVCGYRRTVTPATYIVTFEANGGTVDPGSMPTGADGKLPSLPVPTRGGYTFVGWFTLATGGNQVTVDTVFASNTTVYARWTSSSGGGGGGGSSSSSSSSGGTSVTVPVSGDRNSVQVSATVSGSTATISKIDTTQLNAVAGSDVRTGMVEVDLSGLDRTINTVNLPADTMREIAKAANDVNNDAKGLTIKLSNAEASFDAAALNEIQKQADSQITLTIAPASSTALNARQKETVGNAPVFDLTMKSGSRTITSFGGGYATVSLPYKLERGQNPSGITVYYLDSSGNIHPCETMYDVRTETVVFTTGHLSLYFVAYEETETQENPFADVPADAYYYNAVLWAMEKGVTGGTSATTFSPDSSCTRGQMATFLWRAAGSPEPKSMVNRFTDVRPDAYYYKAVLWCAEQGITAGTSATTFSPDAVVTRAQTVAFLYRAAGSPTVSGSNSFADVSADAYYAAAVQWAVNGNITAGTGATTFGPDSRCTRAQIVTFLYRAQGN